jgi:glucokinase
MAPRRAKRAPRGGIDLGGTKIQAAIIAPDGTPLGDARRPTPTKGGPPDVAEQMAAALAEAADAAGVQTDSLAGIGVGAPGDVNPETGELSHAGNLPDWAGSFALAGYLSDALGAPVRLGNDVDVATNAEFRLGAARPYKSVLGVFWGTGVGGGIVLDGNRWVGRGAAAEIGHVVVEIGGARCPCGRRGCMEAYAGRAAMEAKARRDYADGANTDLFKLMEKHGRDRLTSAIWARALEHEDPMATKLIDRAIRALGAGVASAVNLLDVEAVVFGGGLGLRLGEPYLERIRRRMRKHLFTDADPPAIVLAELGDLGGAIGASLLFDD